MKEQEVNYSPATASEKKTILHLEAIASKKMKSIITDEQATVILGALNHNNVSNDDKKRLLALAPTSMVAIAKDLIRLD